MTEESQDQIEEEARQAPDFNQRAYQWIERNPLVALLLVTVSVAVFVILFWAFRPESAPEGAGFVYTVPIPGQELFRTLWDWLGLLIVPLAVAAGAAYISYVQKRTELDIAKKAREEDRKIAQQARESEQQIANDRLRQATLEDYYDRMTELLLEHGLRESAEHSEVRSLASARTIAVVRGLDGERNRQLFSFLQASKLMEKEAPVIRLANAGFSGINLSRADLSGANLSGADLDSAYLRWTNLKGADLTRALLLGAILTSTNLSGANLSGAHLNGARLCGANVDGANLSGAELWEADLFGIENWTIEQLNSVMSLEGTTMPDGIILGISDFVEGPTYSEWKDQYLARQGNG